MNESVRFFSEVLNLDVLTSVPALTAHMLSCVVAAGCPKTNLYYTIQPHFISIRQ